MSEKREIFADGVGEITLSGGMVRLDLVSLVGSQNDEKNKPRLEAFQRIIMPPDGFLRSFSAMENLVKQLIDAGLVQARDGAAENPGVDVVGAFVGVHCFEIHGVADDMELVRDAVAAVHVTRHPGVLQRLAAVVALGP